MNLAKPGSGYGRPAPISCNCGGRPTRRFTSKKIGAGVLPAPLHHLSLLVGLAISAFISPISRLASVSICNSSSIFCSSFSEEFS